MSLRRNQLKKMNQEQIVALLQTETDSDNIKLIASFLNDKNQQLIDKKTTLLDQLQTLRNKVDKSVHGLNGRVKDRIDKKDTVVMSKDSRPSNQTITELMELYSYFQSQGALVDRNHNDIQLLHQNTTQQVRTLRNQLQQSPDYGQLDSRFDQLHKQCEQEQAVRDALLKERNSKRTHYAGIEKCIDECRREYEAVESTIREKERQLVELSTYYFSRREEDNRALRELPQQAVSFQDELLQAQDRLNQCQHILQDRVLKDIEAQGGSP